MIILVLPLLAGGIIATGVLTTSAAATGLAKLAVRLMLFKSEQLEEHLYSQWDLLVRNGFAAEPEYLEASRLTATSYAQSIVQRESELVFAVGGDGNISFSTREAAFSESELSRIRDLVESQQFGWIEFQLQGRAMVGEALVFEPFDWYVVVSDERSVVFSELRSAILNALVVLAVTLTVGTAVLLLASNQLTRPIRAVSDQIEEITQSGEYSRPVVVDRGDELGQLARRFNYMASTLVSARKNLADFATVATVARSRASAGEQETLEVLGRAAEFRDKETAAHVLRVGRYARLLGELSGLNERQSDVLLYAAPLHDVGKIGIPDSILFKPGPLTDDEFAMIKTHTTIGYKILRDSRSEYLRTGATIALYHHERIDGTGYPACIGGADIPLVGRIVAIADSFDAVTSDRPYKKAWGLDQALELLSEGAGTHYDSDLVSLFLEHVENFREILNWQR